MSGKQSNNAFIYWKEMENKENMDIESSDVKLNLFTSVDNRMVTTKVREEEEFSIINGLQNDSFLVADQTEALSFLKNAQNPVAFDNNKIEDILVSPIKPMELLSSMNKHIRGLRIRKVLEQNLSPNSALDDIYSPQNAMKKDKLKSELQAPSPFQRFDLTSSKTKCKGEQDKQKYRSKKSCNKNFLDSSEDSHSITFEASNSFDAFIDRSQDEIFSCDDNMSISARRQNQMEWKILNYEEMSQKTSNKCTTLRTETKDHKTFPSSHILRSSDVESDKGKQIISHNVEILQLTSSHKNSAQIQSFLSPSIIVGLEKALQIENKVYLNFGSQHFDRTKVERIKNSFQRNIQKSAGYKKEVKRRNRYAPSHKKSNKVNVAFQKLEKLVENMQEKAINKALSREYAESLILYNRILSVFQEHPKNSVTGTILKNIGILNVLLSNFERGKKFINLSINIQRDMHIEKTENDFASSLHILGLIEYGLGNTQSACNIIAESIKLLSASRANNLPKLAEMQNNLACFHIDQEHLVVAKNLLRNSYEWQMKSLRKCAYIKDQGYSRNEQQTRKAELINISATVANIGVIKLKSKDYDQAVIAFEDTLLNQSLAIPSNEVLVLSTLDNLAIAKTRNGDFDQALSIYFNLITNLSKGDERNYFICALLWRQVGNIHQQTGNLKRAIKCIYKVINCFSSYNKSEADSNHDEFQIIIEEEIAALRQLKTVMKSLKGKSTMASF